MLKARVALFAWLVVLAVFVEAADAGPGTVCGGLAGHRIEAGGKGKVFAS